MARRNRLHEEVFHMEDFDIQTQAKTMAEAREYIDANTKSGWSATAWWWERELPALVVRLEWSGEQQSQEVLRDDAPPGWNAQTSQVRSTAEAAALNRIEGHLVEIKGFLRQMCATTFADLAGSAPVVPRFFTDSDGKPKDKAITGELVAIGAGPRDWDAQ